MPNAENQLKPEELVSAIAVVYANFDRDIELVPEAPKSLEDAERSLLELRDLRIKYLGKKSELASHKKLIRNVDPARRGEAGSNLQKFEQTIDHALSEKEQSLNAIIKSASTAREAIDVTIPGRRPRQGHLHPITLMRQ